MPNEIVYTDMNRDYPKGYWTGAVTITKVRNAFRKAGIEVVNGHNNSLNNVRTGCYGFAKAPDGRLVYFSQECDSGVFGDRFLYRAARHDRDWTGGRNCRCSPDELVEKVVETLGSPYWEKNF